MAKTNKQDKIYEKIIDYSIINSNIKKYREKAELTQTQLAEKSHISEKYLSRLENNHYKARLHIYLQIAIALNISIYDLIGNKNNVDDNFADQINLLTKDMTDNQKEMLCESIKLIKKYEF